jgi:hypothetical protein
MANVVHSAVQLNQEGANEFVRGNLTLALDSFRNALQTMIRFEPQADDGETNDPNHVYSPDFAAMGITYVPTRSGCHVSKIGEPFTLLKPFVFNPTLIPQNQDGIAVFSAVVVFNMAVIFHQRSFFEREPYRTKALHLYESSLDLFSKISIRYDLSGIIAVALNNRASLLFAMGDYESSERDMERLQSAMVRAEYSMSTAAILHGSDFQGILLNLLLLRPPRTAQAA